ncbi:YdeI/OmpD-associated family protein [Oleiagrimonas sp. C23AA]|uniref:YdeI/OmpD-associated family protein n=1 Tax=Oleiagrimonas sp. C23AA TaxID=2719047 RepID=UPI00141E0F94|nr:YdeI/OmpD-associated family protein [Oleiagrimonas sp. C23AA]NII09110.1 hypothetical protein [Oleiagrimonas sp. C23AA]
MTSHNRRVDAYIDQADSFARPLLTKLRATLLAHPAGLTEAIKWGAPAYLHQGKLVAGFAAFKQHCRLRLFQSEQLPASARHLIDDHQHLQHLDDLPDQTTLHAYVDARIAQLESGQRHTPKRTPKPEASVLDDLSAALKAHPKAAANFQAFAPGQRREYIEWITEAKRETTRAKRLATTIEWLVEGKKRHWKYENC